MSIFFSSTIRSCPRSSLARLSEAEHVRSSFRSRSIVGLYLLWKWIDVALARSRWRAIASVPTSRGRQLGERESRQPARLKGSRDWSTNHDGANRGAVFVVRWYPRERVNRTMGTGEKSVTCEFGDANGGLSGKVFVVFMLFSNVSHQDQVEPKTDIETSRRSGVQINCLKGS
ncbi:uncharacterized protein LOC143178983 [Calliopsis andreniformis]|uniref:uncharacterized protein LOC143178983 n=1 Tax=Calliopsis andreniformis TaxID=337506 RepID=UPI003FCD37DA